MLKTLNADQRESRELHRVWNELYSATLTLRAVATLLERGEIERAKAAVLKTLDDLATISP